MLSQPPTRGGREIATAVRNLYAGGQTDYALEPIILTDGQGQAIGRIANGDAVIFCCRRGEREIQLTEAFAEAGFDRFPRPDLHDLNFIILTLYHEKFQNLPVAFAPTKIRETLGEVVSRAGLRQLRTSESEKFAHVTYYFSGGNSHPFAGEEDVRIPSPKGIPFDQVPELSLAKVVEAVVSGINKKFDLIVTNFANGDVIGHTSNNPAKIQCAEIVDHYLGQVKAAALPADYAVLITADHGNLEETVNPDGTPHVAHTTNPVQCILIDPRSQSQPVMNDGGLSDIAPTILAALRLDKPSAMSGTSLAPGHKWGQGRKVLLIILDGWGIGKENDTNPIYFAHTPVWDNLLATYPHSRLQASGEAAGLQPDKPGNSEAGHLNLGAGRIILQDDVRLDQAMKDGSFYTNEIFINAIQKVKREGKNLHLIGLLTEKSSHGSIEYPLALLKMARDHGLEQVYLHMIFDGRSTLPGSAPDLLEKLEHQMDEIGVGLIVSGIGRGIALDRDGNYAKTQRAFDAFVSGVGIKARLE